jgi:hypothetical protein
MVSFMLRESHLNKKGRERDATVIIWLSTGHIFHYDTLSDIGHLTTLKVHGGKLLKIASVLR